MWDKYVSVESQKSGSSNIKLLGEGEEVEGGDDYSLFVVEFIEYMSSSSAITSKSLATSSYLPSRGVSIHSVVIIGKENAGFGSSGSGGWQTLFIKV